MRWLAALVLLLIVSAGAMAISDEERLATLASKMLTLPSGDYTMECGLASEVLNVQPKSVPIQGTHYCVLKTSTQTIIGTFTPSANSPSQVLQSYNDTRYSRHITAVNKDACNGKGATGFEECSGALSASTGSMYVYVYDDAFATQSYYLLASDKQLSGASKTFFGGIADFFRGLFS
jgi:hypothetical protein